MYYVYSLIDPRSNVPFYIGKGTGDRVSSHEKFKSSCKNKYKDRVIKKILKEYSSIPFIILKDGFDNENDAYLYEEEIIKSIGINNLTNICESRHPPSQKGRKRSEYTISKIKLKGKIVGANHTIQYVKNNSKLIYNILMLIGEKNRRSNICSELSVTIDLVHKIKKNYNKYCSLLNVYTDFKIVPVQLKKVNGMRQRLFADNKTMLIKLYELRDKGVSRKDILQQLNISPEFYGRVRNLKDEFFEYFKPEFVEAP